MQVKEKVFILRKTRYGDSDLILNCLTPTGARVSLFARSALKSKKRFGGGVLEPTHYIQAIYEDKTSGRAEHPLHTLKEASLIQDFPGLRTDYARIDAALAFVRLISDVVKEGDTDSSDLFNLLGNTLRAAEKSAHLDRLKIQFETKLLANQGVMPIDTEAERMLLSTPISEHEKLPLQNEDWQLVRAKVKRVLTEYIGVIKAEQMT